MCDAVGLVAAAGARYIVPFMPVVFSQSNVKTTITTLDFVEKGPSGPKLIQNIK